MQLSMQITKHRINDNDRNAKMRGNFIFHSSVTGSEAKLRKWKVGLEANATWQFYFHKYSVSSYAEYAVVTRNALILEMLHPAKYWGQKKKKKKRKI